MQTIAALVILLLLHSGCATLFGWNIHAPGVLSRQFAENVQPEKTRVALYIPKDVQTYRSKNRGGRFADPQVYYIGEAMTPMLIEGFQDGFEEFILMEAEPTPDVLRQYGIPYLAVVGIKDFNNRVTMKGQAVELVTETVVYDTDLHPVARFESRGASDARKVFAKKGGPEVNLNSAIEQTIYAIVMYLQDGLKSGSLKSGVMS
ncbi:MAG: hypothetical protein PHN49_10880 [Candidatus Omnitrophica bacterium]|nr:hypothetical protein [Candidatus Omnitrophota bacterium]MDD5672132.1 hypothetical protein [Candidatus Omnitrophota bacterium]